MTNLIDCIGNTPVIKLRSVPKNSRSTIWAKLEHLNPAGSIKDRACIAMIKQAERENLIEPGENDHNRGVKRQHRDRTRALLQGKRI